MSALKCPHFIPISLRTHLRTPNCCPVCRIRKCIASISEIQSHIKQRGGIYASKDLPPPISYTGPTHRELKWRWSKARIELFKIVKHFHELTEKGIGDDFKAIADDMPLGPRRALEIYDDEKENTWWVPENGELLGESEEAEAEVMEDGFRDLRSMAERFLDGDVTAETHTTKKTGPTPSRRVTFTDTVTVMGDTPREQPHAKYTDANQRRCHFKKPFINGRIGTAYTPGAWVSPAGFEKIDTSMFKVSWEIVDIMQDWKYDEAEGDKAALEDQSGGNAVVETGKVEEDGDVDEDEKV